MKIDRVIAKKSKRRRTYRQTYRPTDRPTDICITRAPMELKINFHFQVVLSSGHTNRPQLHEPPEMDVHIQYPCPKIRWLLDGLW